MKYSRKVLIVDDQDDLRREMKKILSGGDEKAELLSDIEDIFSAFSDDSPKSSKSGPGSQYVVDTVSNGRQALEMVKNAHREGDPYILCFIDMRMPGWDGTRTAKEIRNFQNDMEIVIITAYSDVKCVDIVEEVGIPHKILYLKKPFDKEEVSQLAWALTEKWNNEKERQVYVKKIEAARDGLVSILDIFENIELISLMDLNTLLEGVTKQILLLFEFSGALLFIVDEKGEYKVNLKLSEQSDMDDGELFQEQVRLYLEDASLHRQCVIKGNTLYLPIAVNGTIYAVAAFVRDSPIPYSVDAFNKFASLIDTIIDNSLSLPESLREKYVKE